MQTLKETNPNDLNQIYFAILSNFNQLEFKQLLKKLGLSQDYFATIDYKIEIIECLLYLRRRRRLTDFLNICEQQKSSFVWQSQVVPFNDKAKIRAFDETALSTILATCFTVSELRQLCFFIGVDFENFSGYLLTDSQQSLREKDKEILEKHNVDYENVSIDDIRILLKEEWCDGLFFYWQRRRRSLTEMTRVMMYLRPELFEQN